MLPTFDLTPTDFTQAPWTWRGDCIRDGRVDTLDLLDVLGTWDETGSDRLLVVLGNWGDWTGYCVIFDGVEPYAERCWEGDAWY